ncbi:hypothetical protein PInf_019112 [Phytophthora infestans]|nr:hypothetical protein PInf_019112 [Phytophthora infestans]
MYKDGLVTGKEAVLTDLIIEYFANSAEPGKVFFIALSHKALESKNKLLLQLLAQIAQSTTRTSVKVAAFVPLFERLASFKEKQ